MQDGFLGGAPVGKGDTVTVDLQKEWAATGRFVAKRAAGVVMVAVSFPLCGCGTASDGTFGPAANQADPVIETGAIRISVLDLDVLSAARLRARQLSPMLRNPFQFGVDRLSDDDFAASLPVEDPWWDEPSPWESSPWPIAVDPFDGRPELVFLGVVEAPASAGRVAVVKAGETVHHGRVGDLLAGDYRVVAIETPRLDLESADGGGSVRTLWMASGRP